MVANAYTQADRDRSIRQEGQIEQIRKELNVLNISDHEKRITGLENKMESVQLAKNIIYTSVGLILTGFLGVVIKFFIK